MVSLCSVSFAAPNSFRFQGRLTDSGGNPIVGTPTVIFKLYDAETGGNELWASGPIVVTTNGHGLFTASLGPIDFFSIEGKPGLYVETAFKDIGGVKVLRPRQELGAVPYAVYSEKSRLSSTVERIPNGSVAEWNLQENAVTSGKIAPNSITAAHIQEGVIHVGSGQIEPGSITGPHLAPDSVGTDHIGDAGIFGEDIADKTITGRLLADGAVSPNHLEFSAVQRIHVADNAIGSDQIENHSVKREDLEENLPFVPQGAILMFLNECPVGYKEVEILRNRIPVGADRDAQDPDVPEFPNESFGEKEHSHTIDHGHDIRPIKDDLTWDDMTTETYMFNESRENGKRGITPRLMGDFTGVVQCGFPRCGAALTGVLHGHKTRLTGVRSGAEKVIPPAVTVLFCEKE